MTDDNNNSEIVVNIDGLKMKEFRAYWTAVARGDWAGQDKFFARVVRSWPFEFDPLNFLSFAELELNQYVATQKAIQAASSKIAIRIQGR